MTGLYDLPRLQPQAGTRAPLPVDNDSYYTQPVIYDGCAFINDAPSCGGG